MQVLLTLSLNGLVNDMYYSNLLDQGVIAAVKDGFGFITCAERESRMFFHFSEMMDPDMEVKVGEEVEFTVIQVRMFDEDVLPP